MISIWNFTIEDLDLTIVSNNLRRFNVLLDDDTRQIFPNDVDIIRQAHTSIMWACEEADIVGFNTHQLEVVDPNRDMPSKLNGKTFDSMIVLELKRR